MNVHEPATPLRTHPGGPPEGLTGAPTTAVRPVLKASAASGGLRRSLVAVARTQCQSLGTDGVGLTVLLGDRAVYAGANAYSEAIDDVQHGLHEGPCLSTLATRHITRSRTPEATSRRWPRLGRHVAELELGSISSVPIVVDDELLGSLNFYAREAGALDRSGPGALHRAASTAGSIVVGSRLLALAQDASSSIRAALSDRVAVDLAVGLLMDRYPFSTRDAQLMINLLARQDGVSAAAAAAELTKNPNPS